MPVFNLPNTTRRRWQKQPPPEPTYEESKGRTLTPKVPLVSPAWVPFKTADSACLERVSMLKRFRK
eukprot:1205852-Rhodomonas_salina.2